MLPRFRMFAAVVAVAVLAGSLSAAPLTDSLKKGTPELKSVGVMAFGPEGILFVADYQAGAIFAIDTEDTKPMGGAIKVEGLDEKLASLLGTEAKALLVNDLAVNPISGKAYLSVARGKGADAKPALVRIDSKNNIEALDLKDVKFASITLPNPTKNAQQRAQVVTDIAYTNGKLIVAGLSSDWDSTLRVIPFPFKEADKGSGVGIYHGAHGKFETNAPVRTFVLHDIKGETNVLAAYTCTPLVRFPVSGLKPGEKVKGTTIAELGSGNQPLDMIAYEKDGKSYLLINNTNRGVMKAPLEGLDKLEPIESKATAGQGVKYETIDSLKGIKQLDKLDKDHALVLRQTTGGALSLETIELP